VFPGELAAAARTVPGRRQWAAIIASALAALVACGGTTSAVGRSTSAQHGGAIRLPEVTSGPRENVPSALVDALDRALPHPLVDMSEVRSGGPPPDGIPAVDHPTFQRADQVDWLREREPVLSLTVGSESRAYPAQILMWHEIVNDTVAGVPVALTFCPLCDSALGFDRRAAGRVLDFGTSGLLYQSDLVMYDRQTQSLWTQFTGRSVAGKLTGTTLRVYSVPIVSWSDWRAGHPHGWVLSRDTGFDRNYGTNPYPGYDDVNQRPFLFQGRSDGRFPSMTRVVGVRDGGAALAVPLDVLRQRRVLELTIAGRPIVVWEKDGTASALDAATVADGRDVGATGVFDARVDDRLLHFAVQGAGFVDAETGSSWDVLGAATAGPLRGRTLTMVQHVDTFWFAWAAFLPSTQVIRG
jgi:hypothetical protein